jgi:hypothetical protein
MLEDPSTTDTRRMPSRSEDVTRQKPAESVWPVFRPSTVGSLSSRCCDSLLDVVVLEFAHRKPLVVLRKFANHRDRPERQVARRGVVLGRRQTRAVLEMACRPCRGAWRWRSSAARRSSSVPPMRSASAMLHRCPTVRSFPSIRSCTETGLPSSMKVEREPSERQACSLTGTCSSSLSLPDASC